MNPFHVAVLFSLIFVSGSASALEALPTSYSIIKKNIKPGDAIRDFRYTTSPVNSNFRDLYRLGCDQNANPIVRKYAFNPEEGLNSPQVAHSFPLPKGSQKTCSQILRSIPARHLPAAMILSEQITKLESFDQLTGDEQSDFDRLDFKLISDINHTFYGNQFESGTMSFQHGRKTDRVYVFLPGFTEDASAFYATSIRMFQRGNNVIIGTLPGFANRVWDIKQINAGYWLMYAEYIIRMARVYGEKVIVVGSSSGANLGSRMAELGIVDGLYMIQPFFGYSTLARIAVGIGPQVPQALLAFIGRKLGLADMGDTRPIFTQMNRLVQLSFMPGKKLSIPVVAVVAQNDEAVSSEETKRWIQKKAPRSKMMSHRKGHLHRPTDSNEDAWKLLTQLHQM